MGPHCGANRQASPQSTPPVLQEGHRGVPSHWRHVASEVYPESSPGLPRHVTCSTGELTEISPLVLL